MKVNVKICGIRRTDSAHTAVKAGADFIGFNFVLASKRFINPIRARAIINSVRKDTQIVGIFQNATLDEINEHIKFLKLDYVQLHDLKDIQMIKKIKANVIIAFNPDPNNYTDEDIYKYTIHNNVDYILLDRQIQGQGQLVNPLTAQKISQRFKIFLAGGLNSENVLSAIEIIKPFAVDVAGGIETNGVEDIRKIERFIKTAKGLNI